MAYPFFPDDRNIMECDTRFFFYFTSNKQLTDLQLFFPIFLLGEDREVFVGHLQLLVIEFRAQTD